MDVSIASHKQFRKHQTLPHRCQPIIQNWNQPLPKPMVAHLEYTKPNLMQWVNQNEKNPFHWYATFVIDSHTKRLSSHQPVKTKKPTGSWLHDISIEWAWFTTVIQDIHLFKIDHQRVFMAFIIVADGLVPSGWAIYTPHAALRRSWSVYPNHFGNMFTDSNQKSIIALFCNVEYVL